jgi:hypothetical protein
MSDVFVEKCLCKIFNENGFQNIMEFNKHTKILNEGED